jgi:hypothetical protein
MKRLKEQRMTKKFCLLFLAFLAIGSTVYAESFMLFNTPVNYEFIGNAIGQGRSKAIAVQNLLESRRIRYENANAQEDNEMYIRAIVQRHIIRRGDIYLIVIYFSLFGTSKVGIVEFTSDTQYTYWFYYFQGTL